MKKAIGKGLMFFDATLNRKPVQSVVIDIGATHNFVSDVKEKCLGLKLKKDVDHMKAVNLKALATIELAKQVRVKIVTWEGMIDLIVVQIDDFDVVLGMKFLAKKGVTPFYLLEAY